MASSKIIPYDIYITGLGIVGTRQITKEAEEILRKSECVFVLHYQKVMHDYIENELGTPVTDLNLEYKEGLDRSKTYRKMANRVMSAAVHAKGPVTLALYGHPTIFVSPTRLIQEEAPTKGLRVKVLPGVSCIDCIFAEIGFDPGNSGIQMYEATDFLVRGFTPDPAVPLFLWQVGALETGLFSAKASKPERFVRLRRYLQKFYPEDHIVYLLRTATYPFTRSEQRAFRLRDFEKQYRQVHPIHTLYVPPVAEKPVQDIELAKKITSKRHLSKIVE
jgi:tetrapyrrole methylase family protein/MazG family protein